MNGHVIPMRSVGSKGVALALMLVMGIVSKGMAQADAKRPQASRAELEAAYAKLNPEQRTYAEAVALKDRLDNGDFQVGDRVILKIRGDAALTDTFTVSTSRTLELPNIGSVPLNGILRSELDERLREVISHYIKSAEMTVQSLIRISVVGQVVRPGFYNVPASALLGDVFTAAGGLTPISDVSRSEILRGGQSLFSAARVQRAITDGLTLDQMNLHSGDQLQVAEKEKGKATSTVLLIGSIAAALLSVVAVVALVSK